MQGKSAKELYSQLNTAWPENSYWYNYTQEIIENFVIQNLSSKLNSGSLYLNAGSGGRQYNNLKGTCYHVDITEKLIKNIPNSYVSSIDALPFEANFFDAEICVGSVLNYCDIFGSIKELQRTLKPQGYLIIEFERSNTAELWLKKEYGSVSCLQTYTYLNQQHTLWLYSEKYIRKLLLNYSLEIIRFKRFHSFSSLVNRIINNEELAGKVSIYDPIFRPLSYFMAHNMILLCQKF